MSAYKCVVHIMTSSTLSQSSMVSCAKKSLDLTITVEGSVNLAITEERGQLELLTQTKGKGKATQKISLAHARHGTNASIAAPQQITLAENGARSKHKAFAESCPIITYHNIGKDTNILKLDIATIRVIKTFAWIFLNAQSCLKTMTVAHLIADTVIKRISHIRIIKIPPTII